MDLAQTTETTQRRRRPCPEVEVRWLNIKQAVQYTGQSDKTLRAATERDPLTGKPKLDHARLTSKGILSFTREMLDEWMFRHVSRAADHHPDMTKG